MRSISALAASKKESYDARMSKKRMAERKPLKDKRAAIREKGK